MVRAVAFALIGASLGLAQEELARDAVRALTGREITRLHGQYWADSLVVPEAPPPPIAADAEVHAIGVYRGERKARTRKGRIVVKVERKTAPVVLVLTAYEPVEWVVEAADGVQITHVIASGYHPQTVTGVAPGVAVRTTAYESGQQHAYFYCWQKPLDGDEVSKVGRKILAQYRAFTAKVLALTGKQLSSFRGRNGGDTFLVR